ncbi:MAG: prolyl oligopeptidase family serine peptidase [Chloroflexi bacterium]|nr:prolyl oligopeptidase family serine peptidase [Chloroflexota bacterium]
MPSAESKAKATKHPRSLRQRVTFVVVGALLPLIVLGTVIPLAFGAQFMGSLLKPACGGDSEPPMRYEDVNFPSTEFSGRDTPAYFIPALDGNSGTVIVLPTGSAGRGDRMAEIEVYHDAGMNVLTYTSRTCVGGVGSTLGYKEAQQVGDALAYLAKGSDVDTSRIAVHGFSAGGAAAIMAAAQFPTIRAVVAEGGYHDFASEVDQNATNILWFAPLFRLGARLSYRTTTGEDLNVLSPVSVIGKIAPRPILLIYGTNEPSLPGARLELAAAGSNAALWEVPGATHGSYIVTAPDEYRQRVTAFIQEALK